MLIEEGKQYQLWDVNVRQGEPGHPPWMRVYAIHNYQGQQIISGEKLAHTQHVWIHGYQSVPAWATCGVVLPRETASSIKPLLLALQGRPILLGDPEAALVHYKDLGLAAPVKDSPLIGDPTLVVVSKRGLYNSLDYEPLVSWNYQLGRLWWSEYRPTHDIVMEQARKVIELYHEWKASGTLPDWFVQARSDPGE